MLKEGEDVPEIFEDPVVKRSSHWVLSTSALFSKHLREYGWGEVRFWFLSLSLSLARACFSLPLTKSRRSCQTALESRISPALTVRRYNNPTRRFNGTRLCADYMQFTITSRTEMPNEEFAAEISRAAEDLYALYFPEGVPKSRL